MAVAQDTVVVRSRRTKDPTSTLVCLGFCGGGSASYHQWGELLPPDVDLAVVCYPGREGRFLEDFARNWDELAADATAAVLTVEGPYVLFGHSMGGRMAFDVTVRIEASGERLPETVVVSSANAPSRGMMARDMFPAQSETDEQLLDWMRAHGVMPAHVAADPDLRQMALDLMRADIRVRDTFRYTSGAKLTVPLQVLTADRDTVIEPDAGDRWRELALGEFRHDVLPGGHFYTPEVWREFGHFYTPEVWRELPSFIPAVVGSHRA